MEHFRHRPQAGWKLNGFAANSKRFFEVIERFLALSPSNTRSSFMYENHGPSMATEITCNIGQMEISAFKNGAHIVKLACANFDGNHSIII